MDDGQDQQSQQSQQKSQGNVQGDDAAIFSLKLGGDQPGQEGKAPAAPASQPSRTSQPLASAPPPLTPAPITPTPATPSAPSQPSAAPQFAPYPLPAGNPATPASPSAQLSSQPSSQPQAQTPTSGSMYLLAPLPPRRRGPLGRPFPLPLSALIVMTCAALLALAFGGRVLVLHGDWSEGAGAAGVVALLLAITVALGALLRLAAGRRTLGFVLLTVMLLVALTGAGVVGLARSDSLHSVQARAMEQNGQWSLAIHQYQLTGQKAPNAPDIARVYDAWGEQALQQGDYRGALTRFQTVLDDYDESGAAVARAQKGQFDTYVAWLKNDPSHLPYHDAIVVFTNYGANAGCDSSCQTTLADVAPQAHFLYGEQLLAQKQYATAITEFSRVTSEYKTSAYAKQAHAKAAEAYYAYGQQQISSQNCGSAATQYQTLAKDYKDTPEGAKARIALAAPQDVTGFINNAPSNPTPTVHLSQQVNVNTFFFSDEYSTSIDPKSGQFTFKHVAQGTYYITTSRSVPGSIEYAWWYETGGSSAIFTITVTPLCTATVTGLAFSK